MVNAASGSGKNRAMWVTILVAVIGAAGYVLAALIGVLPAFWSSGKPSPPPPTVLKRAIIGIVGDCRGPLAQQTVRAVTAQGQVLAERTSDSNGEFELSVPADAAELLIEVKADGYVPHASRLSANVGRLPITLKHSAITFGIGDGVRLDQALAIVAAKINVTARFAPTCSARAQQAKLSAISNLSDDSPCQPQVTLKALVDRVKVPAFRYEVSELERGKLYEIVCFGR